MAETNPMRVWLIADDHLEAIAAVKGLLQERGAVVESLDISEAIERAVRDRGGRLIDDLKGMWRRASGQETQEEPPAEGEPQDALAAALERGRPDLLVVTSPRFLRSLDLVSKAAGDEPLRVALLPDYTLGGAWLKGAVHAYVIPHEGLRPPLQEAGIAPERVFVGGPAIPRPFAEAPEADALRQEFGLDPEAGALALVLCEHFEVPDLDRIVFQMSLVNRPWQPIFYAGPDHEVAEALRRATRTHGLPARLLTQVPNIHDFIAASNLVVTAPGDERIVGALALDRPLLLVGDPGPVTTQRDFLVAQGTALHVADVLRLGAEVELAVDPTKLTAMAEAATRVGRRTGSQEVADALALIHERREALEGAQTPPEQADEGPSRRGPFEMIGAAPATKRPAAAPAQQGPFEVTGATPSAAPAAAPPVATASPLSAAEAKDHLASMIVQERDLERRLGEAQRDQERWHKRLELAREWNEGGLAGEAENLLRRALTTADQLREQLERVRLQKEKLKERVRMGRQPQGVAPPPPVAPPPAAGSDGRFDRMEVEDDLNRLKARLRDEMGEG